MLFKWRIMLHEYCPVCGNDAECFMDNPDALYTNGGEVRCTVCYYPGSICCDESTAYVAWDDDGYAPKAADKLEQFAEKLRLIGKLQRFSPRTQDGEVRMSPDPAGDVVIYHQLMEIINGNG